MWFALAGEVLGQGFAQGSRPCFGALKKVDGQYCAFITTDSEDPDLLVKDIAKIVEPLNWAECCKFFCKMTPQANYLFNGLGWSRVIERISGECNEYCLGHRPGLLERAASGRVDFHQLRPGRQTRPKPRQPPRGSGQRVYLGYAASRQTQGCTYTNQQARAGQWAEPKRNGGRRTPSGLGGHRTRKLAGTARKYMKVPPPPPRRQYSRFKRSPKSSAGSENVRK